MARKFRETVHATDPPATQKRQSPRVSRAVVIERPTPAPKPTRPPGVPNTAAPTEVESEETKPAKPKTAKRRPRRKPKTS